jgi:hypothetical protein
MTMSELQRHPLSRGLALALILSALGLAGLSTTAAQARHPARGCANGLKHRTPEQTVLDHITSIRAGDLDAAMCDFAADAAVILPGQVVTLPSDVRAALAGIGALLGDGLPEIRTLTAHEDTVLLTFSAHGTPCQIPDGSDTYVVRKGKIVIQTVHDTFVSAPGFDCPLAAPER